MPGFHITSDDTIRSGDCTDIYFERCTSVLEKEGINPIVTAEVAVSRLIGGFGVLCGLEDVITLLGDLPLDVYALPEGSVFYEGEPVVVIRGRYLDFARYETSILGFLCHASGIATSAARIRDAAGEREIYSFGSRRQHPAISYMIERSAWIGGVDGVSNTCAPEGITLAGTMPHAYVMCSGDSARAWEMFDRNAPPEVPRIMLCDTFSDEKREALEAARAGCKGVRLDTPASRRGNMRSIIGEVRWELDIHGYKDVKIFLSGGLEIEDVETCRDIVDAFGIGGAIANAPVIDFSLDLVEIDGAACSKRGKRSGAKRVIKDASGIRSVVPAGESLPEGATDLHLRYIRGGRILRRDTVAEARDRVAGEMKNLNTA